MNKHLGSIITIFLIVFSSIFQNINAQCFTAITAARDTIACGESLFLQQVGVGGLSSDDFTAGTLSGLWQTVSAGYVIGGPCGTSPIGGQHLWFGNGCPTPRFAETVPVDASCGGDICFDFRQETQGGACDGPDLPGEGVYLEYRIPGGAWTQIHYFSPIGFPYTGWQNHCFPIPAAAQTPQTQFRWIQTQTSGPTWDFWGIDNVNIATCAGFSSLWSGGTLTGYTLDTATISPVTTTTYSVLYSDSLGTSSCSDTITVYVEQPSIVASVLSSPCTGSDTLHAQATITANCDYTLELWNYLPGTGAQNQGWSAGTNPQTYHNLDINVNNSLFSNYTMIQGSNMANETYILPVTDGDVLEALFTSLGNAANECMYRIFDSQGNILFTEGLFSVPGSRTVSNGNAINVSCPATASYTYSWTNVTSGGVAGLNNPNVQNPLATVPIVTDFQVVASDSLNPACVATAIVTVQPNANAIIATLTGPTTICDGDPVVLNFNLVGVAPWNLDLNINGTIQNYTLDQFGNQIAGGGPITFYPSVPTTYSVATLSDASGCPASVNNGSITVNISQPPNAGSPGVKNFCSTDIQSYDLSNYIIGNHDPDGLWSDPNGNLLPAPPIGTATFMFDPQTMPAGIYTYTIDNPPCPVDFTTVNVGLITPPSAGVSPPNQIFCINEPAIDFATLLGAPDPNGTWTDPASITSNPPAGSASFNFNPGSALSGNYIYTVTDPTGVCPDQSATINAIVNPLPTATISTSNNSICSGNSTDLLFNLTGSPNFNVGYSDGTNPAINVILDVNGNNIISGNPISVSPLVTTVYDITTITDDNSCVNTSLSTITIFVTPGPSAGTTGNILPICSNDNTLYDLSNQLGGIEDPNGTWTDPNGNVLASPPTGTSTLNYNPQTMPAGNYTYTVSGPPCPDAQSVVTVQLVTPPFAGVGTPNSICINDYNAANLFDLNSLLSGQDPGGQWSDIGGMIPSTIDPNTYGAGTFQFTYEAFGTTPCPNDQTNVNLTIHLAPAVNNFSASSNLISQGGTTDLIIDMSAGIPPFTINLIDNDTPPNTPSITINPPSMIGSITVSPNVISPTTYSITNITDGNGCSSTSPLTQDIIVEPYPIIDPFTATTPVCEGDPVMATMTLIQGAPPVTVTYSYNGQNYNEVVGVAGQACPIVVNVPLDMTNLNVGSNTITTISVADGLNNCPANLLPPAFDVVINPTPSVTFTTLTPEICFSNPATLDFGFLIGTPPFDIDYTIDAVAQTPLSINGNGNQSYTINPNPTVGTHTYEIISVTDANNCIVLNPASPVNIIVNPTPDINITISGINPMCIGQSSELFFPVVDGTPPYNVSYLVDNIPATANIDAFGNISGTGGPLPVSPTNTTTYTLVSVTDDKGCTNILTDYAELVVNPLPDVIISSPTAEICDQEIAYFDFEFTAGTGPWTIDYQANAIPQAPLQLSNPLDVAPMSPSIATVYTFTAISDQHCNNTIQYTIPLAVNPLPVADISGDWSICDDGSTVPITINVNSGTQPYDIIYAVNTVNKLVSNVGFQHIINTNQAGNYTIVNVTDDKGCSANNISGAGYININPVPNAIFTAYPSNTDILDPIVNFVDQSIGHDTVIWNFGDGTTYGSAITNVEVTHVYPAQDTLHIVTLQVETDSGCVAIATDTIIINGVFKIYIPNAFTPNNDLYNDHFLPIVKGALEYDFMIYNRFGQLIFNTNTFTDDPTTCTTGCPAAWNGKVEGKDEYVQPGQYAYAIRLIDKNGKERFLEGILTLIR